MKNFPTISAVVLAVLMFLAPAGLFAATEAPAAASPVADVSNAPMSAMAGPLGDEALRALSPGEVRALLRIISLQPEKLVSLRGSIDALAKMSPEEKQALRKKLENLRSGDGERSLAEFRRSRENPLLRYWHSLPPPIRAEEQARFQKMSPEERRAYVSKILKKSPRRTPPATSAHGNSARYMPAEGDILFQSMPRDKFVEAVESATKSPWSHCGIVVRSGDGWSVLEALGTVHETPLEEWVARGRGGRFSAGRLKAPLSEKIPQIVKEARRFLGRPYDMQFRMDDEYLYCSELVFKAVRNATGVSLAKTDTLGVLNWKPNEAFIRSVAGGELPLEREIITPKALFESPMLERVHSSRKK
ncbi:MAG: hypothetical protein LBG65_01765 [Puniceicoccales bacterium]|jgi:cell wall-associated NlpC family hydrolase|nr:hypothetical protein [Puniceicoccales bacterium]